MRNAFVLASAAEAAFTFGAHFRLRETGGLLLGYWTDDDDVVVTEATPPGPDAQHSLHGFEPDTKHGYEAIARKFSDTAGAITYIGDWHTHPLARLTPSSLDCKAARLVAKSTEARTPRPLVAIVRPYLRIFNRSYRIGKFLPRLALYYLDPVTDRLRKAPVHFLTGIPSADSS